MDNLREDNMGTKVADAESICNQALIDIKLLSIQV